MHYPKRPTRRQRKARRAADRARYQRKRHEARVAWLAESFDVATRGLQAYARAVAGFGRGGREASAGFQLATRAWQTPTIEESP